MKAPLLFSPKRRVLFYGSCAAILVLSGCAHQPLPPAGELPGFWYGLLHGFLILFSFIGSLFTNTRIYAFPNAGRWYDFGFLIGSALFLGGAGASARDEEEEEEDQGETNEDEDYE